MLRYQVATHSDFKVEVDETKFTEAFFEEFSQSFFFMDTVQEAVEYLADLFARGMIRGEPNEFIEGFGPADAMGIRFIVAHGGKNPISADLKMNVEAWPDPEQKAA